jgi:hypothetical protein
MPLQRRLYILVLLAVLPSLAVQTYGSIQAYNQRKAEVQAESIRLAEFVSGELDRIIDNVRAALVLFQSFRPLAPPTLQRAQRTSRILRLKWRTGGTGAEPTWLRNPADRTQLGPSIERESLFQLLAVGLWLRDRRGPGQSELGGSTATE